MPLPQTGARGVPRWAPKGPRVHQQPHHRGAVLTCPRRAEGDSGRARMHTQLIHLRGQECTPGPASLPLRPCRRDALPLGSGRLAAGAGG